jgi:hypothetical protein
MKLLRCLIVASCISLIALSAAAGQDYHSIATQGGVEVMAAFDPLGPNNQLAAYVKFVNKNGYKVNVTWTPFITCRRGPAKKGYGAPFSMEAGASYEVNLWRSSTCAVGSIRDVTVDVEVKKADLYGQ